MEKWFTIFKFFIPFVHDNVWSLKHTDIMVDILHSMGTIKNVNDLKIKISSDRKLLQFTMYKIERFLGIYDSPKVPKVP